MHEHWTLNASGSFTRVSSMCHKMFIHLTYMQVECLSEETSLNKISKCQTCSLNSIWSCVYLRKKCQFSVCWHYRDRKSPISAITTAAKSFHPGERKLCRKTTKEKREQNLVQLTSHGWFLLARTVPCHPRLIRTSRLRLTLRLILVNEHSLMQELFKSVWQSEFQLELVIMMHISLLSCKTSGCKEKEMVTSNGSEKAFKAFFLRGEHTKYAESNNQPWKHTEWVGYS